MSVRFKTCRDEPPEPHMSRGLGAKWASEQQCNVCGQRKKWSLRTDHRQPSHLAWRWQLWGCLVIENLVSQSHTWPEGWCSASAGGLLLYFIFKRKNFPECVQWSESEGIPVLKRPFQGQGTFSSLGILYDLWPHTYRSARPNNTLNIIKIWPQSWEMS